MRFASLASRLSCGTAIAVCLAAASTAANAQSSADRIDAIERQIRSLQGELRQLKGELGATRQQLRDSRSETARAREAAAQARQDAASAASAQAQATQAAARAQAAAAAPAAAKPGPKVVQTSGNRFGLESADGRNSIYLTGRMHLDVGGYFDYTPDSRFAAVQKLNSGVNARRARIGVTGKFAGDWNYSLIYDLGGSSDGFPPTSGAPASGVQSAFITYNGLNKGTIPLAFDLGYMDTPFTLQQVTSSNDILFVERPSIQQIATSLFAGDFRSAAGIKSTGDNYWTGIYLTGPTSGANHTTGEPVGAFGRATYQALTGPDYSIHVGGNVGGLLKAPGSPASVTLSDRPEIRIDPTSILSTGALGTAANPVTGAQVYGVEAGAAWRNFFIQGEYLMVDVDRRGLGTNSFDGGYVEASWVLSGERRRYDRATGAYRSPEPDRPFEPWMDNYGTGAWELAARYSTVNLNDDVGTGSVAGGTQTIYSVGLNWYPNSNMRFMFDFLHGDIDKRFTTAGGGGITGTPLGTPVGGKFDALVMRTQIAF